MNSWLARLFDLGAINATADTVATIFVRHAPGEKWRNAQLVEGVLRDMVGHAKGDKRKYRWGRIKIAILANRLLWKLHDHGYPQDFCKQLSTRFSVAMAQEAVKPADADAPPPKKKAAKNPRGA